VDAPHGITIGWLPRKAARDSAVVAELVALVNDVYAGAEAGLWTDGAERTSTGEMMDLIAAGEILVARLDGEIIGMVRVHVVSGEVIEFGLLAASPAHRNLGVGRALLDVVEAAGRVRGHRAIQLEILVPRDVVNASKAFLKDWYGRRGYRRTEVRPFDEEYPHLAPLLATPCDLEIHQKALDGAQPVTRPSRQDG
jgi:GNAT superfamily N-acetyltransferase